LRRRPPPPPRPLSLCPAVPTCQLVLNLSPTISSPWTRPRPRVLRPRPRPRTPFELAPCSPTPPLSFVPSAQPLRPLSRSAHVCSELRHRLPSTAACSVVAVAPVPHPVPRELRLTVSCSGHPSVCPFPPCCVQSALTGVPPVQSKLHHRRPVEPLRLRRCFATQCFCSR
jgi:hypothetical protein